jgi:hypothetical protein
MPVMSPLAPASQYGAPSPESAGTKVTPSLEGTSRASDSTSDADFTMPSPSRSHCTAAPAMNELPSSA